MAAHIAGGPVGRCFFRTARQVNFYSSGFEGIGSFVCESGKATTTICTADWETINLICRRSHSMRIFLLLGFSLFLLGCGGESDRASKDGSVDQSKSGQEEVEINFSTPEKALASALELAKKGDLDGLLAHSTNDSKESLVLLAPDGYTGKISVETLKERAVATQDFGEPRSRSLVSLGRDIVVFDYGPKEKMNCPTIIMAKAGDKEWKLQAWSMGRMIPADEAGLHAPEGPNSQGPIGPKAEKS